MVDVDVPHYKWVIAVDGSDHSMEAFNQCFKEFYENDDHISVVSVTDKSKSYLPLKFQPNAIYDTYHTILLSHVTKEHYNIKMIEKNKDTPVRKHVLEYVNEEKATMLFFGYRGRKGENQETHLMGSTVKNSIYDSTIPLCIVKEYYPREKTQTGGFIYCVCLDGSFKAYKSFGVVKKLINKDKDKVIFCSVKDHSTVSRLPTIKQRVAKFLDENKVNGEFIEIIENKNPIEDLIKFTNHNEKYKFHFVIFGNNGLGREFDHKKTIGGSAEALIGDVRTNIIMLP